MGKRKERKKDSLIPQTFWPFLVLITYNSIKTSVIDIWLSAKAFIKLPLKSALIFLRPDSLYWQIYLFGKIPLNH